MLPLTQSEESTPLFNRHPTEWDNPWHELHRLAERAGISVEYLCNTVAVASFGNSTNTTFSLDTASDDLDEVGQVLSDEDWQSSAKANWLESLHPRNLNGRFRSKGGRTANSLSPYNSQVFGIARNFTDKELDEIVPRRSRPFRPQGPSVEHSIWPEAGADHVFYAMGLIDQHHGDGNLKGIPARVAPLPQGREGGYSPKNRPDQGIEKGILISTNATFPLLSDIHEIGHHLDDDGLQSPGAEDERRRRRAQGKRRMFFSGGLKMSLPTKSQPPHLQELHHALTKSKAYKELREIQRTRVITDKTTGQQFQLDEKGIERVKDFLLPQELFARAYTQYIAMHSEDREARSQLASLIRPEIQWMGKIRPSPIVTQWEDADFQDIAKALDNLFLKQGWMTP